jgi:hypothetical protein
MQLSDRERGVLEQIEMLIRQGRSVDEAAATLSLLTGEDELVSKMLAYRQAIIQERRKVAERTALFDAEGAPAPWYEGPSPNDVFWPGLKKMLESDPGWAAAVPSLDESSTDVVGLLADPHSPEIRTRGLVLGHVQSGKTANFTATIAKAADSGYRLFIVLSGVHNALRRQTQLRLEEHLYAPHPTKWLQLTDEHRDFGNPVKALPLVAGTDLRLLAVVKKNVSRLTRLRDWLREAHKHGGLDTCPVLIIDDESDQASPNSARNAELDRTRINERIVELLQLPRVAYVGYTATPFANVLINPSDVGDIYPRTFIYPLPKPPTYFGSRELFGQMVSEDEAAPEDAPHDMVRLVSDEEANRHSASRLMAEGPEVTPGLAEAIRWFLLATSARRVRSGQIKHSSMLIHTTMRVDPQLDYLGPIKEYIRTVSDSLTTGDDSALRAMWTSECDREPAERHGLKRVPFDDLLDELPAVVRGAQVVADNSRSTERLIFGDDPATVVAVGGNTLSRGLTLEGLVSSYFLRSSTMYDALLQMGRWFGYRPGYADLPRIWTTRELAEDFEFLADVEDALRREIDRYRMTDGATPANLPVRILRHPRMHATAKLKMQFAVTGDASFSGQRPQTTYFAHKDLATIEANLSAVRELLSTVSATGAEPDAEENRTVIRGMGVGAIRQFVDSYRFHPSSELTSGLLGAYIDRQIAAGALTEWNVVVIGRRPPAPTVELGLSHASSLITRSKLRRSEPLTANIGTLMSRPDRVSDLVSASTVRGKSDIELQEMRNDSGRGLLLIYPIDKDSQPRTGVTYRVPLEADGHLMGVAFSFPQAEPGTEPVSTIQVDPALLAQGEVGDGSEEYVDDEGSRDDVDLGDA